MQRGKPIGSYDLLIARQAIRHGMRVVTANVREYAQVPDLRGENWETGETWAFED
jgi:tRNA(fMet)-specific endonuclease VapC